MIKGHMKKDNVCEQTLICTDVHGGFKTKYALLATT